MAESDLTQLDLIVVGGIFREVIERKTAVPEVRLGGSALTAAIAAARMGVSVAVSSFVGVEDEEAARGLLVHAGVQPELVIAPGASGTFVYPAGGDDEQPRPLYRPAETSPVSLPELPSARTLLLFGMPDFDPPRDASAAEVARSAEVLLWDRQGWLSRTRDASAAAKLQARRRILLTNADEAVDEAILDPETGTITVPSGYGAGVFKDGRRGVFVLEASGGTTQIPAYPIEVQSSVGSGDIFAGVFAAEVASGTSLPNAARLASAATSALLRAGETLAPPDLRNMAEGVMREEGSFAWRW